MAICLAARSLARGTLRAAAKAQLTVTPTRAVANTADSVFPTMARVLDCSRDQNPHAPPCPPKKLFEDNADPVLPGPDHAAVAHHAVALGHQLKPVRNEHRIGHLDRDR